MYSTKHNLEDIMGKRNRGLEEKRRMPRNREKLQNLYEENFKLFLKDKG